MRDQVAGSEVESQLFLENKVAAYHSLVALFIKQGKTLDALLFAERAKGRVLLDVLNRGKSDLAKVLTPAEKAKAQRLNRKIGEANGRIRTNNNAASAETLYRQLDTARLEFQAFQDGLYVAHPDLSVRTGRTTVLTLADINQISEKKNCAYLEYVVTKDQIYLFVLTREAESNAFDLKAYPLSVKADDLSGRVSQFHQRLSNRHPEFGTLARELYGLIIGPADQQLMGISTIAVVPDDFLWNLPFQALLSGNNHYLIEDRALHYASSLSVLLEMTNNKEGADTRKASLIALGNPVIGRDEQRNEELCPLPEAETEVSSIATTFDPIGRVLIGREASEKTFKALAPNYATIHLATHGVIDNRHPLYSRLMLTRTEGDPENDGLLEAREILNMKLNADLAVLSACETANGRISPGEGVVGTSWAFFVAGTRSMLVSQWKVNSASTSQLMVNFYQCLRSRNVQGAQKARSLQEDSPTDEG